jgi:RNA polymerase sigma-70 factor (ECF subfamily)
MLPHLDAAYNLARWLTRNEADAQDVVQEAYMRALRFFDGFSGGNGRAWLLTIVRNCCYTWMRRNRPTEQPVLFDENAHFADEDRATPETELLLLARRESLELCIGELPVQFREVIVMRELEGMSYREVAEAAEVPVGTVMSRLSRARKRLERCLVSRSMGKAG